MIRKNSVVKWLLGISRKLLHLKSWVFIKLYLHSPTMIPFFSYGILLIVTHLHTSLTLLIILINFIDLRKTTLHKKILIGDIKQIHILMYVNSNLVNFTWFIRVMTVVMIAQKQLNSGYVFFFPLQSMLRHLNIPHE